MTKKWDIRFLALAAHVAEWSKDPSTKVGAVIARDKKVVSLGFNGFPTGIADDDYSLGCKATKYSMIVHAEVNAILTAASSVSGCTLYCTLFTCNECAKLIIQSGIKRVVYRIANKPNWENSFKIANNMYMEAGIEVVGYE
jgi:dCMP deaminase